MNPSSSGRRTPPANWPFPSADATGDATGVAAEDIHAGHAPTLATANGRAPLPPGESTSYAEPAGRESQAIGDEMTISDELFARVAKALADPRRFSILQAIASNGEIACQQLCCEMPVKQATVSHHVKELSLAGLVETRRDGQFVYYRYLPTIMRQYTAALATRLQLEEAGS